MQNWTDPILRPVSLPAGCFNPYSGVKTSILIFDKSLAKHSDTVAFFKVENDGFGLGAQRRPIDKNDLPQVKRELQAYLHALRAREAPDELELRQGLVVEKERIEEGGECNLSGERYRHEAERASSFPVVNLGSVAEIVAGQSPPGESYNEKGEGLPFHQGKTEFGEQFLGSAVKWTKDPQRIADEGDIVMSVRAPVGPVNITRERICIGRGLAAIRADTGKLLSSFATGVQLRAVQDFASHSYADFNATKDVSRI